jgi:hypothetical protein
MTIEKNQEVTIGRNEPCPCKSGKKYKRCCGAGAAPKLSTPKIPAPGLQGFDPSALGDFDPQMMMQMSQALQRLPKGQLQRLQSLMQKAMGGQDVSGEAAEFEKSLPPDFQNLMLSMAGQFGQAEADPVVLPPEAPAPDMTVDQARQVIEKAVADGSLSQEEAMKVLGSPQPETLWDKLVGKKGPHSL